MPDFSSIDFQLFLLAFARIIALILSAPLLSSHCIPLIVKIALALFTAVAAVPSLENVYTVPMETAPFVAFLIGETLLGLIMGFFIRMVFAAVYSAGHLWAAHLGFSPALVTDPLTGMETDIMAQLLNLMGIFTFVYVSGFYKIFYIGVNGSFQALTAMDLVFRNDEIFTLLVRGLGYMFAQTLILSMPLLVILIIINLGTGFVSKIVQNMNMFSIGFPLSVAIGLIFLFFSVPFLMEGFIRIMDYGFASLGALYE